MKCNNLCISLILSLCSLNMAAQTSENTYPEGTMAVSYDTGAGISQTDGTNKAESYDVAIMLKESSLEGKQIIGMRIPIINSEGISNLRGWISTELKEGDTETTSLTSKQADAVSGWTDILFDEPYKITDGGVYVGYSFDIDKINNQNLKPISTTTEVNQYGYYLRTSRTRKYKEWYNPYTNGEDKGSLRLQVMVSGMAGDAASVELYPLVNIQSGEEANIPATLYCHGYNGIKTIEYTYTTGEYQGSGAIELDTPVEACYNKFANVKLPISPITELGERELSVTITKVNGNSNDDAMGSDKCTVYVFDFVPKHIPLVEEYSGTWCGNCVRGIASMELMKEKYGEDFICLTYHNADSMAISVTYPSEVRGFPDCWIDRKKNTDPFFGDRSDGQYHFEEEWSTYNLQPTTIALNLATEWTDESQIAIKTKASVKSQIEYFDNEVTIAFVLVADDLYGSKWFQMNYYSGDNTCEELSWVSAQPSIITGLHYNDVVILTENIDGLNNNLPENIKPMTEYSVEHTFDLAKAVNTEGVSLVQDKGKLKIVAIALNANTGEVINCCQTGYMTTSGVKSIITDKEASQLIATKYYNISGIEIKEPSTGAYIKREIYSDGKSITTKLTNRPQTME